MKNQVIKISKRFNEAASTLKREGEETGRPELGSLRESCKGIFALTGSQHPFSGR